MMTMMILLDANLRSLVAARVLAGGSLQAAVGAPVRDGPQEGQVARQVVHGPGGRRVTLSPHTYSQVSAATSQQCDLC